MPGGGGERSWRSHLWGFDACARVVRDVGDQLFVDGRLGAAAHNAFEAPTAGATTAGAGVDGGAAAGAEAASGRGLTVGGGGFAGTVAYVRVWRGVALDGDQAKAPTRAPRRR